MASCARSTWSRGASCGLEPDPPELSDRTGAANTWAPISIDAQRGWVFLPTGSASWDTLGVNRIDAIPDANAVVVLDALTGRRVWSYQTIHHDLWDYDLPAMPTLATIEYQGRPVDAVIQGARRATSSCSTARAASRCSRYAKCRCPKATCPANGRHQPSRCRCFRAPSPRRPHRGSGLEARSGSTGGAARRSWRRSAEGMFTPPSIKGSLLHPSFLGGTNWGGIAYDPNTGLAVVNSSNLVSSVILKPRAEYDEKRDKRPGVSVYEMRGSPYVMLREVLLSPLGAPCNPPPWGQLTAIDAKTGQTRWQIPFGRIRFSSGLSSPASWGAPTRAGRS
jgi:quinoprotein glucose dehydrogenase